MGYKAYETPKDLFNDLDNEFHFTIDVAASNENHLVSQYCTTRGFYIHGDVVGNDIPEQLSELSGLQIDWFDHRIWCNPPYDNSIVYWLHEGSLLKAETSVFLLPDSTSVRWFHEYCMPREVVAPYTAEYGGYQWNGWASPHQEVLFCNGRVKFNIDGVSQRNPAAGNMLVVYRR